MPDQNHLAPDGGPKSHFLHTDKVRTVPTMCVTVEGFEGQHVINASDFNPEIHTEVEPAKPKVTARRAPPASDSTSESTSAPAVAHTREELADMTLENIRTLPAASGIDGIGDMSKEDLINAIIG